MQQRDPSIAPDHFRWVWSSPNYKALGRSFSIRTTDREVGAFLDHAYAPLRSSDQVADPGTVFSVAIPERHHGGAVFVNDNLFRASDVGQGVLIWLSAAVNRLVTQQDSNRVILHAAAAAASEGTIVLPAPMETGKTTLVTAMLGRGFSYLTDEAVAVEAEGGRVEGFAKPLSLDPGSWNLFPELRARLPARVGSTFFNDQWLIPVEGLAPWQTYGKPVAIVFPSYTPQRPSALHALRPAAALMMTDRARFATRRPPRSILTCLAGLVDRVQCYRLEVSDLADACDLLLEVASGNGVSAR